MRPAITVKNLQKSYGSHPVLRGISLDVEQGEIFALLGSNGAGKTTALECMEGLRRYDGGKVLVNGRMGIQLQCASLPEHIRAMEAVTLFAKWNRTAADKGMLEALGIAGLAKTQYGQLSTGQKRRLHLALALIGDPDIVFLDEPTAGLDVEGRVSLHSQIRKLKAQGKTIILASHDMAEVETLCDRIGILHDGKIAFWGTVSELTERVGRHYSILLKTPCGEKKLATDNIGDCLLFELGQLRQKGIPVLDIRIDSGTLEMNFIKVAKGEADI